MPFDETSVDRDIGRDLLQLEAWEKRLKTVGSELDTLGHATEHAFLSVGARLSDFYERALTISRQSSSVASSFSGEDVATATQGLQDLLENSRSFFKKTRNDSDQDVEMLQGILKTMEGIRKPIAGFRKIVKNLSILSISTKIESAQLHDDGHDFTTIADDVERLSVLINSSSADILSRAKDVSGSVEHALAGVLTLQTRQKEKVRSILDRTHTTLAFLIEKNVSSAETVNRISTEFETITRNIGEVVSSIQFHDITRQQVEHVKEALDVAAAALSSRLGDRSAITGADIDELTLDTRAVCALQKAQLADSGFQFAGATKSIKENLRGIAAAIADVYALLEKLAGVQDETSSSFFTSIESEVSSAVNSFQEFGEGIRRLSKTVEDLTETVRDMSKFVDDIENIGMDIELIAVNARIKAARTGSEGAPLGVIAEAIQRLSADAQIQKGAMSDELKEIISTVDRLHSLTSTSSNQQTTETTEMLKNLDSLLGVLRSMNKSALSLLSSIQEQGRRLAADMESTAGSITVQEEFGAKVSKGIESIEVVIAESRKILPEGDESKGAGLLKSLEKNYTMYSERNVHESYRKANGADPAPFAPPAASIESQLDAHFADNVELF
jgi:methyl-accepting chemotaxis protein